MIRNKLHNILKGYREILAGRLMHEAVARDMVQCNKIDARERKVARAMRVLKPKGER